jgi:hypothetical protein
MCILPQAPADAQLSPATPPAHALTPPQRRQLALDALAGQPIIHLALQYHVSRKFVSQQVELARQALDAAFDPPCHPDDKVRFWLPVTKAWLRQLMLALTLVCHSSLRGVVELLRDLFDYPVALGTVHNVVHHAVAAARRHNAAVDLAAVSVGAHDEIYQADRPVLVGVDAASTYCYLLSQEQHCDADTWGVRLLELAGRGLRPQATIADAGQALRSGQAQAWPGIPCRGDVFHLLRPAEQLLGYLSNRAYQAIAARTELERQLARARRPRQHPRADRLAKQKQKQKRLPSRVSKARRQEAETIALADDVAVLLSWLRQDILAVAGPDFATRQALYDFVVAELQARVSSCRRPAGRQRLQAVVTHLREQRDDVLAFAADLDVRLQEQAAAVGVGVEVAREVLQVMALDPEQPRRWQREAALWERLGERCHRLKVAVAGVAQQTVRASSVVENLNSRLRQYFFLRRHLGRGALELLQFFLNHHRFLRSVRAGREGRSPRELLAGQEHPHWLELLGYTRFCRN